jgi:hypothetical protein
MIDFVNPYNFVRDTDRAGNTGPARGHEKLYPKHWNGTLGCTLTTVTEVATKGFEQHPPCIYGSSLKGMIRAAAEAIAQCCNPFDRNHKCHDEHRLCLCCRTFGWLNGERVHAGRVGISDARPSDGQGSIQKKTRYIPAHTLEVPQPGRHPSFYRIHGRRRGRKLYYHYHRDADAGTVVEHHQPGSKRITLLDPNLSFDFRVDFTGLDNAQLGLLLYALVLEDDWLHKLGMGKPLGLGSVRTRVTRIDLLRPDRYDSWDAGEPQQVERLSAHEADLEKPAGETWERLTREQRLASFIEARIEQFFTHRFRKGRAQAHELSHWRDLEQLLTLHDDYRIRYPSQDWFAHQSQSLPTTEQVADGKRLEEK